MRNRIRNCSPEIAAFDTERDRCAPEVRPSKRRPPPLARRVAILGSLTLLVFAVALACIAAMGCNSPAGVGGESTSVSRSALGTLSCSDAGTTQGCSTTPPTCSGADCVLNVKDYGAVGDSTR